MKNESGIVELCEYRVLVLPDTVEEKTEGGIIKPDIVKDKEKHQTCRATMVLRSESAFRDWGGYIPEPGDRVYVAVASGLVHEGPDGRTYRICNDKDVLGRIDDSAWDKKART